MLLDTNCGQIQTDADGIQYVADNPSQEACRNDDPPTLAFDIRRNGALVAGVHED